MSASETDRARPRRPRLGRDFSRLWWAAAVSSLGDGATIAAAPLLATRLTDDPRLIGAASVAFTAPFILFGIPAGLLVDRLDIRAMMVRVDLARAVLLGVLALGVLGGWGGLPLLYACMFLLGVGEVLCRNAAQVLVPFLAPQAGLATANARIMAVQEAGTGFVGPLLGALMFGVATALPFGVDAATFLCSAVLVGRIRRGRPVEPAPDRAGVLSEMLAGARWLYSHHLLRSLALVSCLINLAGNAMLAVLVVHSGKVLHLGPFGYGAMLACQAVGAVVASRFAPALTGRLGREGALVATAALIAVSETVLAAVPSVYAAGAALAVFACGTVTWNVVVVVLRQTLVPRHLLGRANSVYRLVAWGGLPLGAAAGGVVAAEVGTRAVFGAGAAVMAAVAVALLAGARRQWITRADQGAGRSAEPDPKPADAN
ncbi:MFS transporter [Streptomyces somaliensis DSM 40738]|uniref:MFS transporter n=1 Tax=Streptomyces somaliensis (strain ATCC 33201 / DSM 40738 / JCM 12659 / KCTC 9044 / NCTC 11332 / NRRL B-12077 / IP 733) TaxID=1134445 RepID=A0AA44DCS0_STRE0|nr:MFS transporter [Streptomyces somaliensis]MCQ0021848.1 MFS transporter [Streptomyces somaliensis DSM 40738]NKY13995.1 MFS transporter [Streptomyces somaliensis DSM 40738]